MYVWLFHDFKIFYYSKFIRKPSLRQGVTETTLTYCFQGYIVFAPLTFHGLQSTMQFVLHSTFLETSGESQGFRHFIKRKLGWFSELDNNLGKNSFIHKSREH